MHSPTLPISSATGARPPTQPPTQPPVRALRPDPPQTQPSPVSPPLPRVRPITLLPSERWLYCGKTGSGKSYLGRHNLRVLAAKGWRVAIIDPEGFWMGRKPKWATSGPGTIERPRLVKQFDPRLAVQLYIPARPAYKDPGLTQFCLGCIKAGSTIVFFDEIYGVSDANRINEGILEVWTQGRKHDVAGHVCTQRPARIPEYMLSQAENWAVFRIAGDQDRKKLAAYSSTPAVAAIPLPDRYWWYWHQSTMDHAQLMQPLDTGEPATPGTTAVVSSREGRAAS